MRGAETYKFGEDFPNRAPLHNVHLVFTRNVVGSMDYTPVTFSNAQYPHVTTNAHELALSVAFETGIVHFADRIAAYQELPKECKTFLREVPAVWHETKLLAGAPDASALIARKFKDNWYVAYLNGKEEAKPTEVNFSFLSEGTYTIRWIKDGTNGKTFSFQTGTVTKDSTETVNALPYGGFVAVISPTVP